ncbi:MAG: hypothetical protein ACYC6P_09625 [Ignavibacteriaceae bacterium]
MEGWIKLHRKSLESSVFQNANLWQVWSYCLMRANHKETRILFNKREEVLKEGSFITGRLEGAKDCNMRPTTFYLQLKTLEKLGNIKVESKNKFSIVFVVSWQIYQIYDNNNVDSNTINKGQNEGNINFNDNGMTTNRQQNDTDKNVIMKRNINKGKIKNPFSIENLPQNLNGQSFYNNKYFFVTKDFRDELFQKLADKNLTEDTIKSEFYKMESWLEANGAKKNYKLFIINWLSKVKPQQVTDKFNFHFIGTNHNGQN